ncbi:response regulator transcription factor [Dysgonomonas sp. Marseille-P4677]|uniref:response regulator transcription factor n=1 Tax=Dysgonomonas sp. Marseille-P4677 TaxID=2364790 RepID=UPI001912C165|nr:response regulator transcription factor [Dysgonomonas sp. Marseille-P4677]MBK5722235.1 response regulator transcription factor [Dysgonomonas sp. Marseille-P4677]
MDKILIIEDEQRVANLLQRGLEEMGYSASVAYDGEMGLRLFRSGEYNLIISDVILPKVNGFELVKTIKEQNINIPVIMLTALGTTDDKLDGFDAGADDYMVKPFDIRELEARIRILLKRTNIVRIEEQESELRYADLKADLKTKTIYRADKEIKLTPKEFNLLIYMMQNPERVLSRIEIAEKVWNTHFDTGTNFIDVYINYLRKKIDRDFENKLIHTKPGMGFILYSKYENKD